MRPFVFAAAGCLLAVALAPGEAAESKPAGKKHDTPTKNARGASNLDYWLGQAKPVTRQKAQEDGRDKIAAVNPFAKKDHARRLDALPGVIQMNTGRLLAGWIYTTREKPWQLHVDQEKRWRQIPFITVLSIEAVLIEEKMELRWRWKAMGEPERVYTGRRYPFRRFRWKFHLIDGSYVTGTIKGQPIWIRVSNEKVTGPMVLHERFSGKEGEKLQDHAYVRKVIVSRRLMEQIRRRPKGQARQEPAETKPASARPARSADRAR